MLDDTILHNSHTTRLSGTEVLFVALTLVVAHHAIPTWLLWRVLPGLRIYQRLGPEAFSNIHDAISGIMPILLCLGAASRSGLKLGTWRPRIWRIIGVCTLPAILVAIVNPFTSQPFTGGRIGGWLISPPAQDLLFMGYLYGLIHAAFPGRIAARVPLDKAVLITAAFFSAWHIPNFLGIGPAFVIFQLFYTFLFCAWISLTRQWTGSVIPVMLSHMAANFVDWKGW